MREIFFVGSLAFATTAVVQYLFWGPVDKDVQEIVSGQSFVAPEKVMYPLNKEIDFVDEKRSKKALITRVETPLARYVFSSDGASLERFESKQVNKSSGSITTLFPPAQNERETRTFLVAFDEKTPYFYDLIARKDSDTATELIYRYTFADGGGYVEKKFTIFYTKYQIDLELTVTVPDKLKETVMRPRIVIASPIMPEIAHNDLISLIVNNEKGSLVKNASAKLDPESGWFTPTIFGAENRYFVHAMVGDEQRFAQRGYYKQSDEDQRLLLFLEGPAVNKTSSWVVSFYYGPKEEDAMVAVDARLEQLLEYSGVLAPIARLILVALNYLYQYVHNYGLAIIIVTLLIKLFMIPLSFGTEKTKKKNIDVQKKFKQLEQRYKNDQEKLNQEKMRVLSETGMLGMMGGLLLGFAQVPLFIAFNRVLSSSIELYKAPFIGWITDLSAVDSYYILPGLVGLGIFIAMASSLKDAPGNSSFMPIFFGIVFAAAATNFSAGLSVYLIANALFGLLQTLIQRRFV